MPELPEVEVLVHHLAPLLRGRRVDAVEVLRAKVIGRDTPAGLRERLVGARCVGLRRRGKYLVFEFAGKGRANRFQALGHLGMTGRMYLQPATAARPRHAAVVLRLGRHDFVYEDPRYFGRFGVDLRPLDRLGPEPLESGFAAGYALAQLQRSRQPIKVRLLDQGFVAGVGNIYASEILFRAAIDPRRRSDSLREDEVRRVVRYTREVLRTAIRCGSTVPLDWTGRAGRDRLFYYGRAEAAPDYYTERLQVYDRADQPCHRCDTPIRRIEQAGRSTYFCPQCQPRTASRRPATNPA